MSSETASSRSPRLGDVIRTATPMKCDSLGYSAGEYMYVKLAGGAVPLARLLVEQPVGSSPFREYGRGGVIERVNQCDYGHESIKATALYFVR